jgi:hypothetical protein
MINLQQAYNEIAIKCFQEYNIIRDSVEYELMQIEVYLKDPNKKIDDIYIHAHDEQMNFKEIYYHYSGVDICLGNRADNMFCGVLVRGIKNNNKTIYGPGRIAYPDRDKKQRIIQLKEKDINNLSLLLCDEATDETNLENIIFKLPRVNLSNTTTRDNLQKDINRTYEFLNLRARYIRISDLNFFTPADNAPAEVREIFNAYCAYKNANTDTEELT